MPSFLAGIVGLGGAVIVRTLIGMPGISDFITVNMRSLLPFVPLPPEQIVSNFFKNDRNIEKAKELFLKNGYSNELCDIFLKNYHSYLNMIY